MGSAKVFRRRQNQVGRTWRVDETYVRVSGPWKYLHGAVDRFGQTVDFLLTAHRDLAAARRFFERAIDLHGDPQSIAIDKSGADTAAMRGVIADSGLPIVLRQSKYLNNLNGLPDDGQTHYGIGIGVGVEHKVYTGIESKTRVLPLLFFENRYVRFLGLGGDIKLPNAGQVQFALRARYSFGGYEASDAPILRGMATRRASVLAGGALAWRTDFGVATAEALGDVAGHSKGTQVKLGYDIPFRVGPFSLAPHVAANWLDRKTVDYYYGVRASEAIAGRPQYDGRSTVNTEIGIRSGYALARNQIVTLDLGVTLLGSGIKESPLVDRSRQTDVRLGYVYRF